MPVEGYIHSVETFGTLDGPGLRYVVFMQGCPLRCAYCHNPDTWSMQYGKRKTVECLVNDIKNYIPYFKSSGGGVTVSGGEPLLQVNFLTFLFRQLKTLKIHRAIDTSGFAEVERVKELLSLTNLVMLSIKHLDPHQHKIICGQGEERPQALARYLCRINMPVWIRYVIIPGITNRPDDLDRLAAMINKMPNIQKLELLSYNTMGISKWESLGLKYTLTGVAPPTAEEMEAARRHLTQLLPNLKVT